MNWTRARLSELAISIPYGHENKVTLEDLKVFLNMCNIRDGIRLLNLMGVPVVADRQGFWRTRKASEIRAYANRLSNRARSINQRMKFVLKIARRYE